MAQRLFICCCKGFLRDQKRDELYHLLEVDRRATAAEIKSAFRNKSLELHPDKLAQRGQRVIKEGKAADFVNFKHAYDVLSDPVKRDLYNQVGETGMAIMENPFASKDNMAKNFLTMGTTDRLRLVMFVLLVVGSLLLWPIFFSAKVDGETSSSWVALWTPLWVYDALGLWYFLYLVGLGKVNPPEGMEESWTDPYPFSRRIVALIKWVLLIVFQVFLTLRLDGNIDWPSAAVVAPLLGWVVMTLLVHVHEATQPVESSDAEKRQQAIVKRNEARSALLKDCLWIIQLVLVIMQLDGQVDWNWWVVFLPTWVVLFGQLAGCCTVFMLASKLASGTLVEGKEDDELIKAVTSCCGWSVTFVTAILAVAAIAGGHYSTYVVFIPQFVIAGLLVCCMTCIICCIRDLPEDDLDEGDLEEGGRVSTCPHHVRTSYNTYDTYSPLSIPRGAAGMNAPASSATNAAPSSNARPDQEFTPAPENQADGGID